eukprot:CAMPEP_0119414916 /NCGR_PEP_ID=MMETSP1335-20130426/7245_1 /TAXON_ID=259385 /ORGANISM="Chrysoculter rhomboideus, Strain RCC1486" /LENGTH=63 /DNA_ID=CAMNT_0007439813 /DNA_START=385 /DNA_END=573 /DNA_ORIENTATION=-
MASRMGLLFTSPADDRVMLGPTPRRFLIKIHLGTCRLNPDAARLKAPHHLAQSGCRLRRAGTA